MKVDDERFVDLDHMVQKRFDNSKARNVKREYLGNTSSVTSLSKSQGSYFKFHFCFNSQDI